MGEGRTTVLARTPMSVPARRPATVDRHALLVHGRKSFERWRTPAAAAGGGTLTPATVLDGVGGGAVAARTTTEYAAAINVIAERLDALTADMDAAAHLADALAVPGSPDDGHEAPANGRASADGESETHEVPAEARTDALALAAHFARALLQEIPPTPTPSAAAADEHGTAHPAGSARGARARSLAERLDSAISAAKGGREAFLEESSSRERSLSVALHRAQATTAALRSRLDAVSGRASDAEAELQRLRARSHERAEGSPLVSSLRSALDALGAERDSLLTKYQAVLTANDELLDEQQAAQAESERMRMALARARDAEHAARAEAERLRAALASGRGGGAKGAHAELGGSGRPSAGGGGAAAMDTPRTPGSAKPLDRCGVGTAAGGGTPAHPLAGARASAAAAGPAPPSLCTRHHSDFGAASYGAAGAACAAPLGFAAAGVLRASSATPHAQTPPTMVRPPSVPRAPAAEEEAGGDGQAAEAAPTSPGVGAPAADADADRGSDAPHHPLAVADASATPVAAVDAQADAAARRSSPGNAALDREIERLDGLIARIMATHQRALAEDGSVSRAAEAAKRKLLELSEGDVAADLDRPLLSLGARARERGHGPGAGAQVTALRRAADADADGEEPRERPGFWARMFGWDDDSSEEEEEEEGTGVRGGGRSAAAAVPVSWPGPVPAATADARPRPI